MNSKIIFLTVNNNQEKLATLTKIVANHFDLSQKILIATPNAEVASYIDQLLWRLPEESFIPHIVTNDPSQEAIVITSTSTNCNQASILINLCPKSHPSPHEFELIYELYDLTHPAKEESSKLRHASYLESNCRVFMQKAIT